MVEEGEVKKRSREDILAEKLRENLRKRKRSGRGDKKMSNFTSRKITK